MMSKNISVPWSRWVTSHPWLAILFSVAMAVALAFGIPRTTMSNDYRYFFGEENPQRVAFERLQDVYSKDDNILFIVAPTSGEVFSENTMRSLLFLTEESWQLPFSTRVDSLTNFQYTFAEEDDLIVKDLVLEEELGGENVEADLAAAKAIALKEPLLANRMINEESSVTGVVVQLNFPGEHPMEVPEAAAAARELADAYLQAFPDHELYISGIAMLNNAFNEAGMKDMMTLTPAMYLTIILLMLIMTRSVSGSVATFFVMFFAIFAGMGFGGWVGIPLTPPSAIAPVIIMTLAIADSVHILKSIQKALSAGMSKKDAIAEGLRVNFKPVFLTSLTTAVGFLSLNFSDTPPFHDLGNITAIGVSMAFLLSVLFLPGLMMLLPMKVREAKEEAPNPLGKRYGAWVAKNRLPILLVNLVAALLLGLQIPTIELNDEFIGYFDKSIPFRTASEFAMENLTGIYQINFDMNSGETQGIADPEYLQHVENFSNYLRSLPGVDHVNSITDTFKRLNKNMHGDDESYYRLPERRDLAAQYLLLYEMSLPYGLDLNNQIDVDKQSTRVVANLGDMTTAEIIALTTQAETWLIENTPEQLHTIGSSPVIMFSHISARNVVGMAKGTLLAFVIISLIMIVALKSVKYGLLSLIPNITPMLLAYGIWALLVGQAGFVIAIVGSVCLGIAVDDSVHFLSKYQLARKEKELNAHEAIQYAFQNMGGALVLTSVLLVVGFGVLTLSTFKMNFILGALSALTITLALIVDFTLLPAVLAYADRKSVSA